MITIEKNITCSSCKKVMAETIVLSGDKLQDRDLSGSIIDGTLFYHKCHYCEYETYLMYPFIYTDSDKKFIVYLMPEFTKEKISFKNVNKSFYQLSEYKKRIVTDYNSLKEKILVFENGLNDRVIEKIKQMVFVSLEKSIKSLITNMYFCMIDNELKTISFFAELKNGESYYHTIDKKAYNYCKELLQSKKALKEDKYLFEKIDKEWIKSLIKKASQGEKDKSLKSIHKNENREDKSKVKKDILKSEKSREKNKLESNTTKKKKDKVKKTVPSKNEEEKHIHNNENVKKSKGN